VGNTGNPKDTGLFLDAAGISEDEVGIGLKLEKFEESYWVDNLDAISGNPKDGEHLLRPWMDWKNNREIKFLSDRLETVDDTFETGLIINILSPVGSHKKIVPLGKAEFGQHVPSPFRDLDVLKDRINEWYCRSRG